MKKILITICVIMISCESYTTDPTIVETVVTSQRDGYKYMILVWSPSGFIYIHTNQRYCPGDTIKLCR